MIGMSALNHPMINDAMLAAGASASVPKYCAITLPQVIDTSLEGVWAITR